MQRELSRLSASVRLAWQTSGKQFSNSIVSRQLSTYNASTISEDFIVKCPYGDTVIPETNLYSHVFQHFPKYGKKTALIDGVTGREYSYNEVQESVVNMASGLVRSGMQKGDVLALVSPNSVEFCTTFFSTLAMGGIMSTCNPNYTSEELAYQFKNSNSKYVATIPSLLPTIQEAASKAGCVEKMIVLGDDGGVGEGKNMISYQSLVDDSGSRFPSGVKLDYKNDIAVLPYSGGTTGLPKGVMLTHYNVTANINQLDHPQFVDFTDPDCCFLGVLPFFHIYAMVMLLATGLYQGSTNVILPKFEPQLFLKTIQDYRIKHAYLVPPLILFLAKHPMVDNYNLSSIRSIFSAAAPLGGETVTAVKQRLGINVVRQGYGLTELSPVVLTCPYDVNKPSSSGVPVLNTYAKVVNPETGETLGPNCDGELLFKGPQVSTILHVLIVHHSCLFAMYLQVMKGYLNNEKATADMITADGWLHTGDIGELYITLNHTKYARWNVS